MMITIRYFGSLKETIGRSTETLSISELESLTVLDVWHYVNGDFPLAENILTALNMDYVTRSHRVNDGDEVAFFPPVTGG
ncbi:MAG: MoaD/ThiS family protein [Methylococcales bacterium]|nr:MoaD/ThiS family protein [Methylococcales bacterium]